ncbi:hypothetical protein [Aquibacillus saliphilus]|uniref:hypothetical protein n=1 Tax=Aquibacillus saliphilus TaxID=1909422 RepID=UPI001CEFB45C|nr:hypothetical protein [Aquibacillus saliphilus]
MGKKKRGHYCRQCGRTRPNEKFSGKGHRQHICKDCKRKGKQVNRPQVDNYDRELNKLNKAVRNGLILYTRRSSFFLFEYQKQRYVTRDDFESEIFWYNPSSTKRFQLEDSLLPSQPLLEVLFKNFYEVMECGFIVDYDDFYLEEECLDIPKNRRLHLEVIASIKNLER